MCVKLVQTGKIIIPGQTAIIKTKQGLTPLYWGVQYDGYIQANARLESLRLVWFPKGHKVGTIEIDSFFEGQGTNLTNFKFEQPREVGVVYLGSHFLVITEPAGLQVSKVHHRQPCYRNLPQLLVA